MCYYMVIISSQSSLFSTMNLGIFHDLFKKVWAKSWRKTNTKQKGIERFHLEKPQKAYVGQGLLYN